MNYLGSKQKLCRHFIPEAIKSVCGTDLSQKIFCDIFAGTGIVGRTFKTSVKKVISNDIEYYSYVLNRNYIGNHLAMENKEKIESTSELRFCFLDSKNGDTFRIGMKSIISILDFLAETGRIEKLPEDILKELSCKSEACRFEVETIDTFDYEAENKAAKLEEQMEKKYEEYISRKH